MATPPSGEYIPGDLVTEILVRLPVKSLLRCKSVSKPWLSLISNPNFIKSHIKHIITRPGADQSLIVKGEDRYSLSVLHLDSPHIRVPLGLPFSRGDYSFKPRFELVGSCNGLLCVSVSVSNWSNRNNPDIYLWNPATKQSKLIPPHNLRDKIMSAALGFGFDPISNDYKVVRIVCFFNAKPRSAEVYSANTNVWRQLKPSYPSDFPEDNDFFINVPEDYPEVDEFDVCVNGFLCCLGLYGIMAFDLNHEVFTCRIPVPARSSDYLLTDYNDSISFITSKVNERYHIFNFDLWKLDDEACLRGGGVEASWTLMLSIDIDFPVVCVYGCFNNSDFVLSTEDNVWHLYNSLKKEARNAPVSIAIGCQIIKYNESLISITGSKQVDWDAHEDR